MNHSTNGCLMNDSFEDKNNSFLNNSDSHQNGGEYLNGNDDCVPHVKIKSITDKDIIRLIGQHLKSLGLNRTVEQLIQESGCKLDHPSASKFQSHVLEGDWTKAESDLQELKPMLESTNCLLEMKFLLLEEKFFEYLEDCRCIDAVNCLRNELTPLNHKQHRIHELSRFIYCTPGEELRRLSLWEGKGLKSRKILMEKLQAFMPPSIMLPPRRLRILLTQAQELQREKCLYHNIVNDKSFGYFSFLVDHVCSALVKHQPCCVAFFDLYFFFLFLSPCLPLSLSLSLWSF